MIGSDMLKPRPKKHLDSLFRTRSKDLMRSEYMRLDMNESVTGLPEGFIKKTLADIDSNKLASYPEYGDLLDLIARHNGLGKENICLSNGSDAAIKYLFDAYISKGDKILITDPTFAMYPVYAGMFNAQVIAVPYGADLLFPENEFCSRLSGDIKMCVIVNPHNPSGSVIDKRNLLKIIRKAGKCGALCVVDEAYFYYYPHTVIREVKKMKNLVVLRTFSKLCGLAGARIGYAAASRDIIKNILKVKPTYDVNGVAVALAIALLSRRRIIPELVNDAGLGKKYLLRKLSGLSIEHVAGFANFVLVKCGGRKEEIAQRLFNKSILVHSNFSQKHFRDYMRISVGGVREMVDFWKVFYRIWQTPDKCNGKGATK
jgi:Histidinol-phosphate/aromatic aminotransferase and cobyric acid decarboxylase